MRDSHEDEPMTGTLADRVGFEHPSRQGPLPRRHMASLELIAGAALVVSTVVAATVVSIGIARADAPVAAAASDSSLALAVLLGLVLGGWACLTVLMTRHAPRD
jgi:hypothetical protein